MAAFGLAALFAWASSASAALATTENTTGPVGSVDDRAPAAPTNVKAEANLTDIQAELSWDLSADDFVRQVPAGGDFTSGGTFVNTNDVASYQIWRSSLSGTPELIDTVPAGQASYTDTGVESGVSYTYSIAAMDGAGNSTASATTEEVTFGPAGEATPELPPDAEPLAHEVTLRLDLQFPDTPSERVQFEATFTASLADILGIPSSRIRIISVTEGSTIVNFEILEDANNPAADVVALLDDTVQSDPQVFADAGLGSVLDFQTAQTTSVAFGNVDADAEASTTLSFTNSSTDPDAILIVSSSIQGAGFSAAPAKLSLHSGDSGAIDISFAAAGVGNVNGNYTGTLTIITNDPNNSLMEVALSATVVGGLSGAVADLNTTAISFPRTLVDGFSSRNLVISNKGGLSLGITVSISASDALSLSEEGSFTVAGGESKTIEVVFAPVEVITYTATITVTTDDSAHPSFTVTASGAGVSESGPPPLLDSNGNEIFGDFDGDATVKFEDFFLFADNFGLTSASPNWDPAFDLDGDEAVKFEDFFLFADNFGKTGTYASSSESTAITFAAALDEEQAGGTGSPGTGFGDFSYTDAGGLTYDITVEGLTGPITGSHIHNGALGVSGGVVHALTFVEGPTGTWTSSGTWDSSNGLTPALVDELKAGRLYVNIHTAAHTGGEIRGQIEE